VRSNLLRLLTAANGMARPRSAVYLLGPWSGGVKQSSRSMRCAHLRIHWRLSARSGSTLAKTRSIHPMDAVASATKAHAIAENLNDLSLTVAANYYLSTAYFAAGNYQQAKESLKKRSC
jgi:hypothetical protein